MSEITCGLPTKEQFVQQVDKIFHIELSNGRSVELTIVAVEEHVSTPTHENFSVMFRGPADMPAEQAIYSLENEEVGKFELFLVPISKDAHGLLLEAVFNQVPQANADIRSANV